MRAEEDNSRARRTGRGLREPLLLFSVIAAVTFWLAPAADDAQPAIRVTPEVRSALTADFVDRDGRPPDAAELDALIKTWIQDEILFREALARGLHERDARTRHRLVDRMRFALVAEPATPARETLLAWYLAHPERYRSEARFTVSVKHFDPDRAPPGDALERLRAGEVVDGDRFWLGDRLDAYHRSMLGTLFGPDALRRIETVEDGRWFGPIETPRGRHFLRVDARKPSAAMPFEAAEAAVREDWIAAERQRLVREAVEVLAEDYEVIRER